MANPIVPESINPTLVVPRQVLELDRCVGQPPRSARRRVPQDQGIQRVGHAQQPIAGAPHVGAVVLTPQGVVVYLYRVDHRGAVKGIEFQGGEAVVLPQYEAAVCSGFD